jgi:HNH endonuclease
MSSQLDYLVSRIGYSGYNEYLRSEHWKVFNEGCKKKTCFRCGRTNDLHLHHITYERIGEELPKDVVTLCSSCHVEVHDKVKAGYNLKTAHLISKKKKKSKRWVHAFDLRNRAKQQTIGELAAFLKSKGLFDGNKATPKAYKMRFVKLINGKERWDRNKYKKLKLQKIRL